MHCKWQILFIKNPYTVKKMKKFQISVTQKDIETIPTVSTPMPKSIISKNFHEHQRTFLFRW